MKTPSSRAPRATSDSQADDVIVVGRLGAPHGVRGEVHIHSYTTPVENILAYRPWLFRRPKSANPNSRAWQGFEVLDVRSHQDHYLGRIEGFPQREDVATLKGMEIGVPRNQLPDPEGDEFYWRDLIGARVVASEGAHLGTVLGLIETGSHDVLRVRPDEPGQSEVLIPFVKTYVMSVTADEIRVDWDPAWLS